MAAPQGRILVIDDDDAIRTCVAALLRDEGYEVLTAANGVEALDLLAAADTAGRDSAVSADSAVSGGGPDLILLDMNMPALDGWGFAREYRLRPGPHAPILVMTAAPDAVQRAAEVEAHAVLPKPFDIDHALETVRQCLSSPPHHSRSRP